MDEKVLREYLFKEVELVQNVIDRMGNNSFLIKGGAITLVAASLLIEGKLYTNLVALLPWLVFWYLDAYFLRVERLYRRLYSWLAANRLTNKEFLLDMDRKSLEKRFGTDVDCLSQTMFSKTLIIFYGLLLTMILLSILVEALVLQ
jgi:hypothetical protein